MKLDKKGFTLVELMVTISIFAIVMGIAALLILSSSNILYKDASINTDKYLADAAMNRIEAELRYSSGVTLADSAPSGAESYVGVESGKLICSGEQAFPEQFYSGRSLAASIEKASGGDDLLSISVSVLQEGGGEAVYTSQTVLRLVNLKDARGSISGAGTGFAVYTSKRLAPGGYSDPAVNDLSLRSEALVERIETLAKRGNKQQITDYLISCGAPPSDSNDRMRNDKYLYLLKPTLNTPNSWPSASETSIGSSGVLRSYFVMDRSKINTVEGVFYYITADGSSGNQWKAQYIFDTRADCWYKYGKGSFSVANFGGSSSTYRDWTLENLLNWMESGGASDIFGSGTWTKV